MNKEFYKNEIRPIQKAIAERLSYLTDLDINCCYPHALKFIRIFGASLCVEILNNSAKFSGARSPIAYATSILQREYVKRNPQGPDRVLSNLSSMIGR